MAENTPLEHRTAEIYIEATPEQVYDTLADLRRMSEWSPDLEWVEFTEGYKETAEGARFQGRNKNGVIGSTNDCKVHTARRGEELAWDVVDGEWPVTRWRFQMERENEGTRLRESVELFRVSTTTKALWILQGGQQSQMEKIEKNMQQTLEQVKQSVEAEQPAAAAS